MKTQKRDNGFTLMEIIIAMAVGSIVMAGTYTIYNTQVKFHTAQEEVVGMQQNLRAAIYFMVSDIRMAGYDPDQTAGASIVTASPAELLFTKDLNEDGDFFNDSPPPAMDKNEQIRYALSDDDDDDGIADGLPTENNNGDTCNLGKASGAGSLQPVSENIDALNFVYFNGSGAITATVSQIQSIQITIVARTGRRDINYTDTRSYTNPQGTVILPAQNDNYRRRMLTQTVKCRNLT